MRFFDREPKYRLSPRTARRQDAEADHRQLPVDDLLASIGYGKTSVQQVLGKLAPTAVHEADRREEPRAQKAAR